MNQQEADAEGQMGGGFSQIDHIQPYWDKFVVGSDDGVRLAIPKQSAMGAVISVVILPPSAPPFTPPPPHYPTPSPPPPAPPHKEGSELSTLGAWLSSSNSAAEWSAIAARLKLHDKCCATGEDRSKCCPESTFPTAHKCIDGISGSEQGWANFCMSKEEGFPWLSVQASGICSIFDMLKWRWRMLPCP